MRWEALFPDTILFLHWKEILILRYASGTSQHLTQYKLLCSIFNFGQEAASVLLTASQKVHASPISDMEQLLILTGQLEYICKTCEICMYSISNIFNAGMMYSIWFPNAIRLCHSLASMLIYATHKFVVTKTLPSHMYH